MAYRRSLGLLVAVLMVLGLICGISLYTRTAGSASSSSGDGSYVWIGWKGGLIKLCASDGTVASQITGTANVRTLATDSDGQRIWTYGDGTLSCYGFDGVKTLSLPFPDSDEDGEGDDRRRATLAVDPADHALWIGAGKVLYRLDSSGGVQVSVTFAHTIRTLAFDTTRSLLWVGTRNRRLHGGWETCMPLGILVQWDECRTNAEPGWLPPGMEVVCRIRNLVVFGGILPAK